jgi:hypothetical protein
MTVVRQGLQQLTVGIANTYNNTPLTNNSSQIGIVFGVITTKDTPTKELFKKYQGENNIGTIFYLPYNDSNKNKKKKDVKLDECLPAKPLFSFMQDYPLPGEQVILYIAPSPDSQESSTSIQTYYLPSINSWNNVQHNSFIADEWKTFIQNEDIRNLLAFEGDRIYQGRKANGIRFGTTVKSHSDLNEWSNIGNDGDPITIMVNGYVTTNTGSYNIEEVNKELSSIYMTSTQAIPLTPGASIVNPNINTTAPKDYVSSQLIFNSDRITLNSKKDEVLLFAKTNIELNSDNIININAGQVTHINSPSIALGTNPDGSYPTEPVLLGNKTHDLFLEIFNTLINLANSLSSTVSTAEGTCLTGCNVAGSQLFADISRLQKKLDSITSEKVYTI